MCSSPATQSGQSRPRGSTTRNRWLRSGLPYGIERQPSSTVLTSWRFDQIAASVAFLCSHDAAQITGTTLSVDGGWTAQ